MSVIFSEVGTKHDHQIMHLQSVVESTSPSQLAVNLSQRSDVHTEGVVASGLDFLFLVGRLGVHPLVSLVPSLLVSFVSTHLVYFSCYKEVFSLFYVYQNIERDSSFPSVLPRLQYWDDAVLVMWHLCLPCFGYIMMIPLSAHLPPNKSYSKTSGDSPSGSGHAHGYIFIHSSWQQLKEPVVKT